MSKPHTAEDKLQRESRERLEIIFKDDPLARPQGGAVWSGLDIVHTVSVIFASVFVVFLLYRFGRFLVGLRSVQAKRAEAVKRRREFKVAAPAVDLFDLPALPKRTEMPDLEDVDTNLEADRRAEAETRAGVEMQPKAEPPAKGASSLPDLDDRETNIAFKNCASPELDFEGETRAQKKPGDE